MERLIKINHSDIAQELGVEPCIQQVEYCVLHTADIHIYRQHFIRFLSGYQFLIVVIIHIPQEIPGRSCPLRHGIGLSFCIRSADRTLAVYPLVDSRQRRFSGSGRLIGLYIRQTKGQFFFRHRHIAAVRTVNDRDRLSPVSLTGEYPVTQLVVYGCASDSFFLNDMRSLFFQDRGLHTIPLTGIDHDS